jgi:hypothetical protein
VSVTVKSDSAFTATLAVRNKDSEVVRYLNWVNIRPKVLRLSGSLHSIALPTAVQILIAQSCYCEVGLGVYGDAGREEQG